MEPFSDLTLPMHLVQHSLLLFCSTSVLALANKTRLVNQLTWFAPSSLMSGGCQVRLLERLMK